MTVILASHSVICCTTRVINENMGMRESKSLALPKTYIYYFEEEIELTLRRIKSSNANSPSINKHTLRPLVYVKVQWIT